MKIVVDIDEVVVDFHEVFLNYYNLKYGKNIYLGDIMEYKSPIFGKSKKETFDIFNKFFNSDDFSKIGLKKGAFEGINFLDDNFDIIFVTARMKSLKSKIFEFFNKFFPDRNFNIIFVGDDIFNGDKFEICQGFRCDLIIEDKGEICLDFAEKGMRLILVDKPWNQKFEHENISRCRDWDEILVKVKELRGLFNG
jgi:uncharacterized HAD superfamily protein